MKRPRPKLLTLREVSDELQVAVYTLREWIRAGKMAAHKIGRDYRVCESELQRLIDRSFIPTKLPPAPAVRIPTLAEYYQTRRAAK